MPSRNSHHADRPSCTIAELQELALLMQDLNLEQSFDLCREFPGILHTLKKFSSWCEEGLLFGDDGSVLSDFINKAEECVKDPEVNFPSFLLRDLIKSEGDWINTISKFSSLCAVEIVGSYAPMDELPGVLAGWPRPTGKTHIPLGDWERSYREVRDQQKEALRELLSSGKLPPALSPRASVARG